MPGFRLLTSAVAGLLAAAAVPAVASAATALDPTFAHAPLSIGATWSQANDLALQPDGGVVLAGRANAADDEPRLALTRLTAGGELDPAFGDGGQRLISIGDGGQAYAVARLADGRLVAVGGTDGPNAPTPRWSLARLTAGGDLDSSFGDDGTVDVGIGPFAGASGMGAAATEVVPLADGRLLVAGTAYFPVNDFTNVQHAVVARFEADGDLDPTFGGGDGWIDFDAGDLGADPFGLAAQPDGGFVLGVDARVRGRHREVVARFTAAGTLDSAWGEGGTVLVDLSAEGNSVGHALAAAPDGATIVAGEADATAAWAMAAVRVTPGGAVDAAFGTGGRAVVGFDDVASRVDDVAVDAVGGAITLAGSAGDQPALARLWADGTPDPAFGPVRESLGAYGFAYGVALTADGRVVVGGVLDDAMFAARFGSASAPDGAGGGSGSGSGPVVGAPTPPASPAPAPAPAPAPEDPAGAPSAGGPAGVPLPPSGSGTSCAGRRTPVTYTLRNAGIWRGGGVSVWQGGRRVPIVVRVRSGKVTIDPRSLPSGTYQVRLAGRSRTDRPRTVDRTLRTCRP
jgi:uncharacterized delta-60 repeat protein